MIVKHYWRYCDDFENIENYEVAKKDNFIGWDCHHRLETHNSDGERRLVDLTKKELIALGVYYHRPAEEHGWQMPFRIPSAPHTAPVLCREHGSELHIRFFPVPSPMC